MLADAHAHLDSALLLGFVESLAKIGGTANEEPRFRIVSNSIDLESSKKNLEIGSKLPKIVVPFVGIHPQTIAQDKTVSKESIDSLTDSVGRLARNAGGIGEIGLDPKYGSMVAQTNLFEAQLRICESADSLPITIHSKNSLEQITSILSTHQLSKNRVLFHWFSGTEGELSKIQSKGYFVSFGPAMIFSRKLQRLFLAANEELVMAETDSPLFLSSLKTNVSPFAVASVLFKMAQLKGCSYVEIAEQTAKCVEVFICLRAQNSLRLGRE